MAGRPKIFNEEIALEKASDLFWKKGYEATSTDDLINVMGIQRGSFYNTFVSKKKLFVEAINFHEKNSFTEFRRVLNESDNRLETLKLAFTCLADCNIDEHRKGCFAGNTVAELSGIDEELADNAKSHLKELEEIFYKELHLAKEQGLLKTKAEPRVLARYLLNLWNGLNITRRVYPDKESLLALIELQLEILN